MHKTAKAGRSFRADGLAIVTRWPTLVAFLLIAAFSGAGFQTAGSMLQQCRHLFDNEGAEDTAVLAKREQPRIAVTSTISDNNKSTWPGSLDGVLPAAPAVHDPLSAWRGNASMQQRPSLDFAVLALARGPPSLS